MFVQLSSGARAVRHRALSGEHRVWPCCDPSLGSRAPAGILGRMRIDFDPEQLGRNAFYRLLTATVVPRPISAVDAAATGAAPTTSVKGRAPSVQTRSEPRSLRSQPTGTPVAEGKTRIAEPAQAETSCKPRQSPTSRQTRAPGHNHPLSKDDSPDARSIRRLRWPTGGRTPLDDAIRGSTGQRAGCALIRQDSIRQHDQAPRSTNSYGLVMRRSRVRIPKAAPRSPRSHRP